MKKWAKANTSWKQIIIIPPTPNKTMWMKMLQSQFSGEKKMSEESRHCPCEGTNTISTTTTTNGIVEIPFSLKVLTEYTWTIFVEVF